MWILVLSRIFHNYVLIVIVMPCLQLAAQAAAHQDQLQRQLIMDRERERLVGGMPPHLPPPP